MGRAAVWLGLLPAGTVSNGRLTRVAQAAMCFLKVVQSLREVPRESKWGCLRPGPTSSPQTGHTSGLWEEEKETGIVEGGLQREEPSATFVQ